AARPALFHRPLRTHCLPSSPSISCAGPGPESRLPKGQTNSADKSRVSAPVAGADTLHTDIGSVLALQITEQTQDLDVEPDQAHQDAEGRSPGVALGQAHPHAFLDLVEAEHEAQRGDHDDDQAESDRQRTPAAQSRVDTEQ